MLSRFSRDGKRMWLEEKIRAMPSLSSGGLALRDRGSLTPGYFADIVIFDPE